MSTRRSRTAEPIAGAPRGAAMGTWGMWLTVVVLGMFIAGMAAAALYLHTGQPAWPPDGIDAPSGARALAAVLAAAVGATLASVALARMGAGMRRVAALLVLASLAAIALSCIVMIDDLRVAGFRWDEHAYTSLFWVLTGTSLTFVGAGALMIGGVLVHIVTGVVDDERHLELVNTVIYLWFAVVTTAVLLGLVHLLPTHGGAP